MASLIQVVFDSLSIKSALAKGRGHLEKSEMQYQAGLLDHSSIAAYFDDALSQRIWRLYVKDTLPSTNDFLLARSTESHNGVQVCLTRHQSAGRGRNGREWYSPDSCNIYMSVGYRFVDVHADKMSCLSVSVGVAICHMLKTMGVKAGLKWPNDILVDNAKLAGVLIESKVTQDSVYAVIGVGLNVVMPEEAEGSIDQAWTDLAHSLPGRTELPDINGISSRLIEVVVDACVQFESVGFVHFKDDWQRFEILSGQQVNICTSQDEFLAEVVGIDDDCGLRIDVNGTQRTVYAGDIKLKL